MRFALQKRGPIPVRGTAGVLIDLALVVGFVLLPFSTGPGQALPVLSYGLPFFALAMVGVAGRLLLNTLRFPATNKAPVVVGALYTVVVLASLATASDRQVQGLRTVWVLLGFVVFLYVFSVCSTSAYEAAERSIIRYASVLVVSGSILALYFLLNMMIAVMRHGFGEVIIERYVGGAMALPWGASNVIAAALLMPLFASLFIWKQRGLRSWRPAIPAALILAAILATMSRNALSAVAIGLLAQAIFGRSLKSIAVLVLVFAVAWVAVGHVGGRNGLELIYQTRLGNVQQIEGLNGRLGVWTASIAQFTAHPWEPVGYYGSLNSQGTTSHNILLTALVEQGPSGVVATAALLLSALWWAWKARYRNTLVGPTRAWDRTALFCGMLAIVANLQLEDAYFTLPYCMYFWTFLALAASGLRPVAATVGSGSPAPAGLVGARELQTHSVGGAHTTEV